MYGKTGVLGSDSGYCEQHQHVTTEANRRANTDYLIDTASAMGADREVGDGSDRSQCRRLSTDLITPQLMVSDKGDLTSSPRMTGASCQALRHAVAALNRLDDFTTEKIGSGFFSEVFKVTHRTTAQVMVLKMNLLRSNRPNMLKEVQLMNQLSHPNILGFMGVCVHEGQLHALTEYINGGSLEQLNLCRSVDLPHRIRMKLAADIACGMEYLHSRGVFHRDLTSKNVLIKLNEETEERVAVVGDFGLAAKIPDPKSGYRLPTVGSPYWMSPECLKGQWYDQRSDIFSYGIVVCELIARIEADPDVLPRTENFGLDYLAFAEMCPPDCPSDFLKLAFHCCTFEPKSRPSFADIVKSLRCMATDTQAVASLAASTTPDDEANMSPSMATSIAARSVEVIPNVVASAVSSKEGGYHKKLTHRRSLSEDVGTIVFPPHTAPSDKARCHFVLSRVASQASLTSPLSAKHVGESMLARDPHYKPTCDKANPFAALSQFRGVKKILGAPNAVDLFSSCLELPSPLFKPAELRRVDSVEEISGQERDCHWLEELAWKRPRLKRTQKTEDTSSNTKETVVGSVKGLSQSYAKLSMESGRAKDSGNSKLARKLDLERHRLSEGDEPKSGKESSRGSSRQPLSLPGSPTMLRRRLLTTASSKPGGDYECLFDQAGDVGSSILGRRSCSSNLNLADAGLLLGEVNQTVLKRRGSCESGFFSSIGEDFGMATGDLLSPEFGARARVHNTSSATLSSSSAASSLFLLDDSAVSTTTVSSIRSGSDELGDLDDMASQGAIGMCRPHHSLLFAAKRSSSIYTDSSEDISSLGGSDIYWEELSRGNLASQPQQISKIVEYFERKQDPRSELMEWLPASSRHQLLRARSSKIALLRKSLERAPAQATPAAASVAAQLVPTGVVRRNVNATQRLMICEGAVKSKLPLFDKK